MPTTQLSVPGSTPAARVERHFLGWNSSALDEAAARLIEHYTAAGEARMDRAVVVLPGARAGRRLAELLLEHAERRGVRLVPPRTTKIGDLPELLYETDAPLAEPALTRRVWAQALRALGHERVSALFPYPPEPDDLPGWATLARIVERLRREVGGAGLRFVDVADRCAEGLLHDDGARWRILAEVSDVYLDRLLALGYVDRHEARLAALESGKVATDRELWLVGVVEMPGIVRRALASLPETSPPVRVLVHAPESLADGFDDFGCVRPEAWTDAEPPIDDARITIADRPADQATAALGALAALGGRLAPDEVTIGVPDREVVPFLEQRLAAAGIEARDAAGVPIARTGPFRLLTAIADYLDGRRFAALATLLRHPDLWRWLRRQGDAPGSAPNGAPDGGAATVDAALVAADRYFRDALPAQLDRGLAEGGHRDGARNRAALAAVLDALDDDAFLGRLKGTRRLAEWAPLLLEVLVEVYGDRPLDTAIPEEKRILESSERIRAAAAALHRLPEAVDEPCGAVQAIRLLLAEVERDDLPPEADTAAVELLGWLELHLDDAPALVLTGLNEPHLPESVTGHAFLPNALRTRLGLVDNVFRYARDAYQLTAILHSRPHVHLVAGRATAAGDPLRPSRLLLAAPPETIAERVLRFYREAEASEVAVAGEDPGVAARVDGEPNISSDPGADAHTGEARSTDGSGGLDSFALPPEPVLDFPAPERLRVTDFAAVLRDPYRFVLERVHGLEPLDDAAAELDGLVFGSLAHEVLGEFGQSELVAETEEARIAEALDELLDRVAGQWFGAHPLPTVLIQIEQLRARLRAFAEWQARRAEEGWRIVAVEAAPPGGGVDFDVDGEPVNVRGRIDRIDHHPELDRWVVFDYKTSDAGDPPEKTHRVGPRMNKRWVDLQLPLYRHLAAALRTEDDRPLVPPRRWTPSRSVTSSSRGSSRRRAPPSPSGRPRSSPRRTRPPVTWSGSCAAAASPSTRTSRRRTPATRSPRSSVSVSSPPPAPATKETTHERPTILALPREMILASAGSGKTFRISSRIIGLLAHGEPPESILASTFTRKAAGEILSRVLVRLAEAALDEEKAAELAEHAALAAGEPVDLDTDRCLALLRDLVRRLHRLNIGTLDAFFIRGAQAFAHEIGLPPAWSIADEPTARRAPAEALQEVLRQGGRRHVVELVRLANKGRPADRSRPLLDGSTCSTRSTISSPGRGGRVVALPGLARDENGGRGAAAEPRRRACRRLGARSRAPPTDRVEAAQPRAAEQDLAKALASAAEEIRDGRLGWFRRPEGDAEDYHGEGSTTTADPRGRRRPWAMWPRRRVPGDRAAASAQIGALGRLVAHFDEASDAHLRREGAYRFDDVTRLLGGSWPLGGRPGPRTTGWTRGCGTSSWTSSRTPRSRSGRRSGRSPTRCSGRRGRSDGVWSWRRPARERGLRGQSCRCRRWTRSSRSTGGAARAGAGLRCRRRYGLGRRLLAMSWRSSQVVLDAVNQVFGGSSRTGVGRDRSRGGGRLGAGLLAAPAARDLPGHVRIVVGPRRGGGANTVRSYWPRRRASCASCAKRRPATGSASSRGETGPSPG